ncbi:hypothetical protein PCCS19_09130 [Paenibacillus sp. CCS19]|uniref:DUF1648 domain-containing protein n=1 Tax=Paenibacillus sp. CCS19 TaxID=3158387 RepID=UPI0025676E6D|nr:DUF1648 domain-containing protein [Paenibacillus cellulosilyticus]GMK37859.1 hypothetical protein PCCS19_09130 [Paenibacillus cellulosilyticus]
MDQRPVIRLARSPLEVLLEVLNIIIIVGMVVYFLIRWWDLPSDIPIHFDGSGEADGWGNRATLLLFPIMAIVPYSIITAISRFPHTFNYPIRITEQNAPELYRLTVQMLVWLKFEIVLLFASIGVIMIRSAENGRAEGVGIFTIIAALVILGTVFGYLIYIIRRFRTPRAS